MEIKGRNKECAIRMQISVENQFDRPGIWLKGNLHCHPDSGYNPGYSIVSPKQLCEDYLARGFDFLASTDYYFKEQTNLAGVTDGLITFAGAEMAGYDNLHLVCVGIDKIGEGFNMNFENIERCVRDTDSAGGLTILAHPHWSRLNWQTVAKLSEIGVVGFEISNRLCCKINGRERSDQMWDQLFDNGVFLAALGSDDWHALQRDVLGETWTGVLADKRSADGILEAIRARRTYASEGPLLRSIRFDVKGSIIVECSPCVSCFFMSSLLGVAAVHVDESTELFEVDLHEKGYRLKDWLYVCIEEANGRRAWSSGIKVKNIITEI
ncbi:MAG: hypothetical protein ABIG61_16500 [Planctomycetota bacterium]